VTARASSRKGKRCTSLEGPDGAHGLANETDEPARVLMASTLVTPEVVEYPDLKQVAAQARTGSQTGDQLWLIHDVGPTDSSSS
jgi:uncharacterized cupin superfamily protein